jgi:2-aminoadipate transaminase
VAAGSGGGQLDGGHPSELGARTPHAPLTATDMSGMIDELKDIWGSMTVPELGAPNVTGLHEFRQQYQGMGRRNGEREAEARASLPAGTNVISMGGGMPEHALLPMEEISKYIKVAWDKSSPSPLEYGSSSLLKTGICQYLERTRGVPVAPEELVISTGNQGGIKLVCDAYLGPNDVAIIESPLWTSTVTIVKATGADVACVGMDSEGIDLKEIEEQIHLATGAGKHVRMIYLQPLFHNPTGVTMSRARAEALLALAAKHKVVVVCDEAYEAYLYSGEPTYLSALSGGYGVLTIHTFSKTLGTGLRLGYVHSAPEMLAPIRVTSLTQASVMIEYGIGELMADGKFDTIVDRARTAYGRKLDVFVDALESNAGQHITINKSQGGFFVWMQLNQLPAEEVQLKMMSKGVLAGVGENFFGPGKHDGTTHDGREHAGHIRLAFIGASEEELVEAAVRIGVACDEVAAELGSEVSVAAVEANAVSARL